jgi:hypothetical protein
MGVPKEKVEEVRTCDEIRYREDGKRTRKI